MEVILFIIFAIFIIKYGNKQKKMKQNKIFKQRLQESAITGIAGGVAANLFIHQLLQQNHIEQDMQDQMREMDLMQLQDFALEHNMLSQGEIDHLMEQMQDPYINPGLDHVIDEHYHGIDHGLGIADPNHFDHGHDHSMDHNMNDFGSSFDNNHNF